MAAGETHDQLELIAPSGQVSFYDLDPARGVVNIGRHPDNDIVIDSPTITPYHAVLDYHEKPYRLILLNGATGPSREVNASDLVQLDGYSLVLVSAAGEGSPAGTGGGPALTVPPAGELPLAAPSPSEAAVSAPTGAEPATGGGEVAAAAEVPTALTEPIAAQETSDLSESEMDLDMLDAVLMATEAHSDEVIVVQVSTLGGDLDKKGGPTDIDLAVDAGQTATLEATLTNGGDLVATFEVVLPGLPPDWVTISPPQVNLREGERVSVLISIAPPRRASSRARGYFYAVHVRSPQHPERYSSTPGMLVVKPFYEFTVGNLDPRRQTIGYSRSAGRAMVPIVNLGNSDAAFRVMGEDDRRQCRFEFEVPGEKVAQATQAEVKVPAEQTLPLYMRIIPTRRQLVALGQSQHPFTVTVTSLDANRTPRSVLGQVQLAPLIGPLPIVLFLLAVAVILILVFRPAIYSFDGSSAAISAGETVTLSWKVKAFAGLHLDPNNVDLPSVQGSVVLSPTQDTLYTLTASNLLSRLAPQWFQATRQYRVAVSAVLPAFRQFSADRNAVTIGDTANVSWDILRADSLTLIINGAAETLLPKEYIGHRSLRIDKKTTVQLVAVNAYTPPEGVSRNLVIDAVPLPPVIPPPPVIKRFDATPLEVSAGQLVQLTWEVTGVTKANITGVGDVPASGSVSVVPPNDTIYTLTASNGMPGGDVSQEQKVVVHPAPTPSPIPGTPKIDFFKATPSTAIVGSASAATVQLSWQVSGDTTNIEVTISGGTGKSSGLPKIGSMNVQVSKATLYVLTAYNGSLTASQTAAVTVSNPAPTLTSLQTSQTTATGGSAGMTLGVYGSNFTQDSKVLVNNTARPTAFIDSGTLSASLYPDDLRVAGVLNIQVFTPTPGGGTSTLLPLTVVDPAPQLVGVTPPTQYVNAAPVPLNVTGSGFVSGDSKVYLGLTQLPTTFISAGQLNAAISAQILSSGNSYSVTVRNPGPNNTFQISNALNFTVSPEYPVPELVAITPTTALAGATGFWIDIQGTDDSFINGTSLIGLGGIYLPRADTVFSDSSHLKGYVNASLVPSQTESLKFYVLNPSPGGGQSNTIPFTFTSPSLALSPNPTVATLLSDSQKVMTVTLSGAQSLTRTISLTSRSPSIVSVPASVDIPIGQTTATFTATASAASISTSNNVVTITAQLPAELNGGIAQAAVQVLNPVPMLAATPLSPSSALLGSGGFYLTVTGQYFVSNAIIYWNTTALPTTYQNNTSLRAYVQSSYVNKAGAVYVSVQNPAPGGGYTAVASFDLQATLTVYNNATGVVAAANPLDINCGSSNTTCSLVVSTAVSPTIVLTATPNANYAFANWTSWLGDSICFGTSPTCSVSMNQNHHVRATFSRAYDLTLTMNGQGAVTSSPAGINCDGTSGCTTATGAFAANSSVILNAASTANWQFTGWSGDGVGTTYCQPTSVTCREVMSADRSVTANFQPQYWVQVTLPATNSGTGSVTSNPSGISCGSYCRAPYTPGTVVILTATPSATAQFMGWGGVTCSTFGTAPCQLTVNSDITDTTATFTALYSLTINKSGTGTGTVTGEPGGLSCGSTCSGSYLAGTTVVLTATASGLSTFTGWSGGGCATANPCTVSMTSAQTVTANFDPPASLTVSKSGSGSGTVIGEPGGINCGSTCSATYTSGATVVLTATASGLSTFTGWSGGGCATANPCTVSVTGAQTVVANFDPPYPLNVTKNGTGTVTSSPAGIACGSTCSASFASGTAVTLAASASGSNVFTGWSGDCSGTGSCNLSMTTTRTVVANFVPVYTLTISALGTGAGTVVDNLGGINCPGTCSAQYAGGTSIVLTGTATGLSTFAGWSGGTCAGTTPCSFSMPASALTIYATFNPALSLTVNKTGSGSGTVVSSPGSINCGSTCTDQFASGTTVTLTPTASGLSTFTGWGGVCSGFGTSPCTITLTSAQTVSANFDPPRTLTVNETGSGSGTVVSSPGTISCPGTCSNQFATGTTVVLTATASGSSTFTGWTGICSGFGTSPCSISLTADQTIGANFATAYNVTITLSNPASGTVTSDVGGINCGATCVSSLLASGTTIKLTAAPIGTTFSTWTGTSGCNGLTANPLSIILTQNETCQANFP